MTLKTVPPWCRLALFLATLSPAPNALAQAAPALLSQHGPTFRIPAKDVPPEVTLVVYGDMRFTDTANTSAANPTARRLLVEKIASEHPQALQLTGDIPLAGGNAADYKVYATETESWRKAKLRVYPALGNHEFAGKDRDAALENWWTAFPELRNRRWYSVGLGARIYLLTLDSTSDLTPESEQRRWLEDQMKHLDKRVDFVFIALHHPPVADVQQRFQVDHNPRENEMSLKDYFARAAKTMHARLIVTAGHIHNYERFEENGVTYLVSGGGGAHPYDVERTPDDRYQAKDFPNFHYIRFTLRGRELKGTMFRLTDPNVDEAQWQPRDTFTVSAK